MPWRPLPSIAFAIAVYPFQPTSPHDTDLPLELGDELYIIEQGGKYGDWYRGYLVAPPSTLSGLTADRGKPLESRVFSGIFPRSCVEIREVLGDSGDGRSHGGRRAKTDSQATVVPVSDTAGRRTSSQLSHARAGPGMIPLTPQLALPRHAYGDEGDGRPLAPVPMLKIGDETPTSAAEPLVDEIASCLREWHSSSLHELLLARDYAIVERLRSLVTQLNIARRQLLHDVLTASERESLREQVIWKLVQGNKMLGKEVIVRDPTRKGMLATGEDSAIRLATLQSEMGMLDAPAAHKEESCASRQLLCKFSATTGTAAITALSASLMVRKSNGSCSHLSEAFQMNLHSKDATTVINSTTSETLFTDIVLADIAEGSSVYLVVKLLQSESATTRSISPSRPESAPAKGPHTHVSTSMSSRRSAMWNSKSSQALQLPDDLTSPLGLRPETTPKEVTNVTRVVALGAINVSPMLRQQCQSNEPIELFCPTDQKTDAITEVPEDLKSFLQICLPSRLDQYAVSPHLVQINAHLASILSDNIDALMRHGTHHLQQAVQTQRIGFVGVPQKPRSDVFLFLDKASIVADGLFSHPLHGQVPAPTGALDSLQLTLEVRKASGARIERCIYASSDGPAHTAWRSNVVKRGMPWAQVIRITVPSEDMVGSHVVMSLANAPDFPCALCWMPLWDKQTFIRDGSRPLLLHAYDRTTSAIENGKGAYLSQPWSSLGKDESAKDESVTGPLATVTVSTELCSTRYTQEAILFSLTHWREQTQTEILETLYKTVLVPEIEFVKQVREVFDALFGILVEHAGHDDIEDHVFESLVTVLGIVHDRRYNLQPLVERYIQTQFYFPFATPGLIRSFSRLLQAPAESPSHRVLRATFKIAQHVLRFITTAREQQEAKENDIGVTGVRSTFNRDIHFIFRSIERLIQNPNPILVGSKTLIVQHFHLWLPELMNVLPQEEVVHIAMSFMDSCQNVRGMLILYKLVLILHFVSMPMFSGPKAQRVLLGNVCRWTDAYWGDTSTVTDLYRDQVRLCCSIVASLLPNESPAMASLLPKAVASYAAISADEVEETEYLSLIFSKSFPFQIRQAGQPQRLDEVLLELSVIIAAICGMPRLNESKMERSELVTFVTQTLECQSSVLSGGPYPIYWLSLHIYHHRAAIDVLRYLSTILMRSFIPPLEDAPAFNTDLWRMFFSVLMGVVSSESLALETFPEQKRRVVWKVGGDVREAGSELLRQTWNAIGWEAVGNDQQQYGLARFGGYQVQYVPNLVPHIVKLCVSRHASVQDVAVDMLWSLIASEWQLNEDISTIETALINGFDALSKAGALAGNPARGAFINQLYEKFERAGRYDEPRFFQAVKRLLETIDELLELLGTPYTDFAGEAMRTLRLMEFMRGLQAEDIFIRYVHDLAFSHAVAGHHTEAGLALQLHADLYDWEQSRIVPALLSPEMPVQTSFERKEYLYCQMIRHFEEGKAWSQALACYKELAEYYENVVADYSKLSNITMAMGNIYDLIARNDKRYPRYFRIVFRGLGFPEHLRDKQYIVEGLPSEKSAAFAERLQDEYPAAQVGAVDDSGANEGQYIQVSSVSIHRNLSHPIYQRPRVPMSVREHLLASEASQFSVVSSRFTAGTNYDEHWITKSVFTTAEPFPNLLKRSEIIEISKITLDAIATAIERTWRKTQELLALHKRAASGNDDGMHALTRTLRQLLDTDSSETRSVAVYHGLLTAESDRTMDGESDTTAAPALGTSSELNALRVALLDHAMAIERCLALFARPAYSHVYNHLKDLFESLFADECTAMRAYDPPTAPLAADNVDMEEPEVGEARLVPAVSVRSVSVQPVSPPMLAAKPINVSIPRSQPTVHSQKKSLSLFRRKESKNGSVTGKTDTGAADETGSEYTQPGADQGRSLTDDSLKPVGARTARTGEPAGKGASGHQSPSSGLETSRRSSWFSHNGTSAQGEALVQSTTNDRTTGYVASSPRLSSEASHALLGSATAPAVAPPASATGPVPMPVPVPVPVAAPAPALGPAAHDRNARRSLSGVSSSQTPEETPQSVHSFDSRRDRVPSTPFSGASEFSVSSRGLEQLMSSNDSAGLQQVLSTSPEDGPRSFSSTAKKGSVRGSVMKRISLLKVGKKGHRLTVREQSLNVAVNEE
ncbi:hypothetical protein KEM52_000905 [Ascosphaera acerosa]|nr:hypothetical protein KEM52_000905 [Ascosphaera acerosa]